MAQQLSTLGLAELQAVVSCTVWVLGTEISSSIRGAGPPNC